MSSQAQPVPGSLEAIAHQIKQHLALKRLEARAEFQPASIPSENLKTEILEARSLNLMLLQELQTKDSQIDKMKIELDIFKAKYIDKVDERVPEIVAKPNDFQEQVDMLAEFIRISQLVMMNFDDYFWDYPRSDVFGTAALAFEFIFDGKYPYLSGAELPITVDDVVDCRRGLGIIYGMIEDAKNEVLKGSTKKPLPFDMNESDSDSDDAKNTSHSSSSLPSFDSSSEIETELPTRGRKHSESISNLAAEANLPDSKMESDYDQNLSRSSSSLPSFDSNSEVASEPPHRGHELSSSTYNLAGEVYLPDSISEIPSGQSMDEETSVIEETHHTTSFETASDVSEIDSGAASEADLPINRSLQEVLNNSVHSILNVSNSTGTAIPQAPENNLSFASADYADDGFEIRDAEVVFKCPGSYGPDIKKAITDEFGSTGEFKTYFNIETSIHYSDKADRSNGVRKQVISGTNATVRPAAATIQRIISTIDREIIPGCSYRGHTTPFMKNRTRKDWELRIQRRRLYYVSYADRQNVMTFE